MNIITDILFVCFQFALLVVVILMMIYAGAS